MVGISVWIHYMVGINWMYKDGSDNKWIATDEGKTFLHVSLFNAEIKYLHDNGFKVITVSDLGYDENSNYLYVKNG
jgi:hypothetical protein